jgi:putative membrane protein
MSEEPPNAAGPRANLPREGTSLASYQTKLALDRTTLAWVRTALTMASFGFGMVAFFRSVEEQAPSAESLRLHRGAIRMGTALLVLGIVATALAGFSHWSTLRRLGRGEPPDVSPWSLSIAVAMLTALIGLAGLWELFVR